MNRVILSGRLARDPNELKRSLNNNAVIRFTIAVDSNRSRRDDNSAVFVDCVAFNKTAEFVELYFKKGMLVGVDGKLQSSVYERDGSKISKIEVVCDNVEFLETKASRESRESATPVVEEKDPEPVSRPTVGVEISDDSFPFE